MDNAGNLTETVVQTIMVDTITPSLSLQVDGTRGQNDFYTTSVTVTPNASDATSGINKIEAMIDNGAWTVINSPLFFADGNHSYQVRVTDNAGNVTETPMQTLYIDASPAVIAMLDDALVLGDGLFYSIEDSQSGLTELRVVIKDNEGKYKSVTWVENLDGSSKYKDSVRWDGRFSDGTYPTPGIYYIALKVINGAGVETIGTATIEVPVVKTAEQESIPALILPALVETVETVVEEETVVTQPAPQAFGSSNNPFTGNSIQTSFSANSTTTPTQSNTTSNILWGGAAAALLGATLAEWQKKREEEAARLAAMRNSGGEEEEDDRPRKKTAGQIAYEKKQQQKRIVAESQALMNQKKATQQAQSKIAKDKNLAKAEAEMSKVKPVTPYVASSYLDKEEETWLKGVASQGAWAAVNAREEAKKAEQERLNNVYAARWAGLASVAQENNGGLLSMLWNASISALGTIASPLKNIYSNKGDNPTVGETLVPRPSRWTIYYLPDQAVMKTYLAASINVQSDGKNVDEKDKNSHLGPAQLSRNELDTPYKTGFNDDGSICERANCRGYGLGLPGEDPNDNVTAVRGMGRRIQQVFDRAENLSEKYNIILTNTDKYIIAAMAQNGPGFDYNDINRVMTPENGFITDSQINWEAYFEVKQGEWEERVNQANKNPLTKESAEVILYNSLFFTNGADFDTRYSLEKFYDETSNLEDKGYSLPQDLDIERIKELITNDLSTGVRE